MVRAAVSASQASVERPGSAPAPFSACPQAEPRPEAQKRTRGTCAGHVCEVARVGARGGACTCERQRQTCVCIWALGSRGALGPRTCLSRFSFHCAAVHTRCETHEGLALGDNQGRSERGRVAPFRLLTVACQRSPCSSISQWRRVPLRTILRRTGEELSVYNRPETPSMPGLLRLFRAACDSTSSIDATRSMRVSMYRARAC